MRKFLLALAAIFLGACTSESDAETGTVDAGTQDGGTTGSTADGGMLDAAKEASAPYVEPNCSLRNDTGGPGQYNDSCVQRSWIKDYAGTYTSAACELTITVDGSVAATFTMKILSGPQAGTYTIDWEGGTGVGNDSYYRFTTDATFTTTTILNFNAGQKVGTGNDERNASLRVEGLNTSTPVLKGRYAQTIAGKNDEVDCGAVTKK